MFGSFPQCQTSISLDPYGNITTLAPTIQLLPDPELPTGAMAFDSSIICPECKKTFHRPCDLNRHTKTHTRPFKCSFPDCKYSTRGFPTLQECRRHFDDRHSSEPPIFKCHFESCQYTCRRESNCKQHMAKLHKLAYKNNRKNQLADEKAAVEVKVRPQSDGVDFILFPEETAVPNDGASAISAVYSISEEQSLAPWDSPMTHREEVAGMIHDNQTLGSEQLIEDSIGPDQFGSLSLCPQSLPWLAEHTPLRTAMPWLEVSEAAPASLFTQQYQCLDASLGLGVRPMVLQGPSNDWDVCLAVEPVSQAPAKVTETVAGMKRNRDEESDDDDDDDSEDGDRPPRKQRALGDEINEDQLICPFRCADPGYFDRDNDDRFMPCHTEHKFISTLVRHLSRAAHCLSVTDRYISSFGVPEQDTPQPRAGLCRRCWTSFSNKATFDAHISQSQCPKVSRSKREKYTAILNAFCTLSVSELAPALPALLPAQPIRRNTRSSWRNDHVAASLTVPPLPTNAAPGSPNIKDSPTQQEKKSMELLDDSAQIGDFVPRTEYQSLQRQVHAAQQRLDAFQRRFDSLEHAFRQFAAAPPRLLRSATGGSDSNASLVGWMDRQTFVETDAAAGSRIGEAVSGSDVRSNAINLLLTGVRQPRRTMTILSSGSGSSVIHVSVETPRTRARSQTSSQRQRQNRATENAGSPAAVDVAADSQQDDYGELYDGVDEPSMFELAHDGADDGIDLLL